MFVVYCYCDIGQVRVQLSHFEIPLPLVALIHSLSYEFRRYKFRIAVSQSLPKAKFGSRVFLLKKFPRIYKNFLYQLKIILFDIWRK